MAKRVWYRRIGAVGVIAALGAECSARGDAVPQPFQRPAAASPEAVPDAAPHAIVLTALDLQGSPYRDGGETVNGFDCSGFAWYVFAQHGIQLPRRTVDQYQTGAPIDRDALVPGDLVFFTTVSPGTSHVGVSMG